MSDLDQLYARLDSVLANGTEREIDAALKALPSDDDEMLQGLTLR